MTNGYGQKKNIIFDVIAIELMDIVGFENVITNEIDRMCYGSDQFWVSKLWIDRGVDHPIPDIVVFPATTKDGTLVILYFCINGFDLSIEIF